MCGIAGVINRDGRNVTFETVKRMTDAVAHRGPNGEGHLLEGCVGLGHRRLSILDLSEHGHQPMGYDNSGLSLVFNGEIYNYIELRSELTALGYTFSSGTDSEVILAAYDRWGFDCVQRFNGMWAFAVLDRRRNIVFFSRDRFGIKPLYYLESATTFVFGSEIRQLLPFLPSRRVNMEVLRAFVVTGATELDDATFFQGVRRLLGGHYAVYALGSHRFEISRYYSVPRRPELASLGANEAIEMFAAAFEDAVKLRLRSDVKVGTCLSGGLDSSSVATLASHLYHTSAMEPFSAITAVSEEAKSDESGFAGMIVEANGLSWHKVKPCYRDFADCLPQVVESQEEPFGGPSIIMQHFVMKTARENGVTVLLDGQGGDETLLGYEKYYAAYIVSQMRSHGVARLPAALRAINANNAKMGLVNIARFLVAGLSAAARYQAYKRRHSYIRKHGPAPAHLKRFSKSILNVFDLQALELESTNLPALLRYEDKNSMAQSIEARLPFLDYRLVELNLSLPDNMKIHDGWTKWILRKAMDGRMPEPVVWRKNKFAFEAPDGLWLKAHRPEMEQAVFASPLIQELADLPRLRARYGALERHSRWRLYSLALWEQKFRIAA